MTPVRGRTRRPLFALYLAGAVSLTGNVAALVAIPWFVLQTTGSAAKTGVTAFAALLPVVLSGSFGGALVDRLGYRRMSVLADAASAVAVAAIPLLHVTVGLSFWQLVGLVFLGGLLDAPGGTARSALLPEAAERAGWSLERATGATAVVERGSRLAGAPLAGVLIALVGATNVLWLDAATFVVSAVVVLAGVPKPVASPVREGVSYVRELLDGARFIRRDRTLFTLIGTVSLTNALDSITIVGLPVYAMQAYGSATSLGLLMGAVGAGSVAGALGFAFVGDRLSRRDVFTWGFVGVTLWYPVAALYPPLVLLLAVKFLTGLASGPLNPVIDTVLLERVPDGMRGRVLGVTQALAWVAMPLGVLGAGYVIDAVGIQATLVATGAVYLAVTLGARFAPAFRDLDRSPGGREGSTLGEREVAVVPLVELGEADLAHAEEYRADPAALGAVADDGTRLGQGG